jgi:hypothetical protein
MELLEAACRAARVSPQRVAFVQAAAAGSNLGDSVEACALHEVHIRRRRVGRRVQGAAGAHGGRLGRRQPHPCRAVLCLQQRRLPANPLLACRRAAARSARPALRARSEMPSRCASPATATASAAAAMAMAAARTTAATRSSTTRSWPPSQPSAARAPTRTRCWPGRRRAASARSRRRAGSTGRHVPSTRPSTPSSRAASARRATSSRPRLRWPLSYRGRAARHDGP